MKKLLYLALFISIVISCTNKETYEGKKEKIKKDSVVFFPDEYKYTRAYRDSIDKAIKTYSYSIYGDSNLLEEGLPDSMKLNM